MIALLTVAFAVPPLMLESQASSVGFDTDGVVWTTQIRQVVPYTQGVAGPPLTHSRALLADGSGVVAVARFDGLNVMTARGVVTLDVKNARVLRRATDGGLFAADHEGALVRIDKNGEVVERVQACKGVLDVSGPDPAGAVWV